MNHNTDQLQQLIKMANQIAVNQPAELLGQEVAVAAVAEHIQKFWAPPMREKIRSYLQDNGQALNAVAKLAIARIT